MNGNKHGTVGWVDPDDAPDLSEVDSSKVVWRVGEQRVSPQEGVEAMREAGRRGRPKAQKTKLLLAVRYDADIVQAFKATGAGWQTRMNAALREWLKSHPNPGQR